MNHEGREGFHPFSMRLPTPLSPEAEDAMTQTIGAAFAVHKVLGPGYFESIYKKAMHVELTAQGIAYESEKAVVMKRLEDVHRAQVISYLKTTGLNGALLVNFNVAVLKVGLQRIVLSS